MQAGLETGWLTRLDIMLTGALTGSPVNPLDVAANSDISSFTSKLKINDIFNLPGKGSLPTIFQCAENRAFTFLFGDFS